MIVLEYVRPFMAALVLLISISHRNSKGAPRCSIKLRNIDCTINRWLPLDSQYYCTIILIAQIIVSCRGNIGSCAIYCAIVTLDVKSYCTNSQCSPLCITSFLIPIYLVSYIYSSFRCIYINALSISFILFLFHFFTWTRLWIIFSSLFVSQLYFLNCLLIWSLFEFFYFIGRSFSLFSFL